MQLDILAFLCVACANTYKLFALTVHHITRRKMWCETKDEYDESGVKHNTVCCYN